MNVSFEGIRCQTNERKRYALGQDNGTWIESHVDDWQLMQNISQFYPHRELATYYLCSIRSIVGNELEAIRALKVGMHPRVRCGISGNKNKEVLRRLHGFIFLSSIGVIGA